MDYNDSEQKGRFALRALLWFLLIAEAALALLPVFLARTGGANLLTFSPLLRLLPLAVVLWAVYRGSFPGLVVFFLGTFTLLVSVTDYLGPGGPRRMGELISGPTGAFFTASLLLSVTALLLRLGAIYCVFRSDTVSRYFDLRRCHRVRKDLILETVLFVLSLLIQLVPFLVFLLGQSRLEG